MSWPRVWMVYALGKKPIAIPFATKRLAQEHVQKAKYAVAYIERYDRVDEPPHKVVKGFRCDDSS